VDQRSLEAALVENGGVDEAGQNLTRFRAHFCPDRIDSLDLVLGLRAALAHGALPKRRWGDLNGPRIRVQIGALPPEEKPETLAGTMETIVSAYPTWSALQQR